MRVGKLRVMGLVLTSHVSAVWKCPRWCGLWACTGLFATPVCVWHGLAYSQQAISNRCNFLTGVNHKAMGIECWWNWSRRRVDVFAAIVARIHFMCSRRNALLTHLNAPDIFVDCARDVAIRLRQCIFIAFNTTSCFLWTAFYVWFCDHSVPVTKNPKQNTYLTFIR